MKNRLQTLWTQVVPHRGPCPMPGARDVLRRVDAALDAEARPQRRPLRAALVLAAALALLTGAAFASGQLALPKGSVGLSHPHRPGQDGGRAGVPPPRGPGGRQPAGHRDEGHLWRRLQEHIRRAGR